jgi:CD63 antigen
MGAGQKVVKWLMLVFNLLFWVSGIGLIIAGALAQTVYKPYLTFIDQTYVSAPVLLIVVGAVITIIAFFGCCGSAKENYCMLITFAVLLSVIFFVELAGGIVGYIERDRVSNYLQGNMEAAIGKYNKSTDGKLWDAMQKDLGCCGVKGWEDWFKPTKNSTSAPGVPESCCKSYGTNVTCTRDETYLTQNCAAGATESSCPINAIGCCPKLLAKLQQSIAAIGGVGIGVAFIQIIGIGFACFLARRVKRGYTYA